MMASYIFELMSQTQANTVTSIDSIGFSTTAATALTVTVTASPASDTIRTTTITSNGKSLTFDQQSISAVSEANNLVFNDSSNLRLGTNGNQIASDFHLSSTQRSVVYGLAGDDVIAGLGGDDYIYAGNGNDTVTGGAGNEHLYGFGLTGDPAGDGADSLLGGGGNDYIQGNAGADTIDGGDGNDRLVGGSGADVIIGGSGQDTINGNLGNDTINGGSGQDSLRGGQGNDSISGDGGNDVLLSDLGNDTLIGGAGVDLLTGGDGADVFQFGTGDATGYATSGSLAFFTDTIVDFTHGADELRISSAVGAVGDIASEIVRGDAGASFTAIGPAIDYAQGLLNNNTTANDVAIVRVSNDVYLFYASTGVQGATIDSIVKIQGATDPSLFTMADFS
jgi:serralysin